MGEMEKDTSESKQEIVIQAAADALSAQCVACAEKDSKIARLREAAEEDALTAAFFNRAVKAESALAAIRAELAESNRLAHEFQRAAIINETAWQRAQDEIRQFDEARKEIARLKDVLRGVAACVRDGCEACKRMAAAAADGREVLV